MQRDRLGILSKSRVELGPDLYWAKADGRAKENLIPSNKRKKAVDDNDE